MAHKLLGTKTDGSPVLTRVEKALQQGIEVAEMAHKLFYGLNPVSRMLS